MIEAGTIEEAARPAELKGKRRASGRQSLAPRPGDRQ